MTGNVERGVWFPRTGGAGVKYFKFWLGTLFLRLTCVVFPVAWRAPCLDSLRWRVPVHRACAGIHGAILERRGTRRAVSEAAEDGNMMKLCRLVSTCIQAVVLGSSRHTLWIAFRIDITRCEQSLKLAVLAMMPWSYSLKSMSGIRMMTHRSDVHDGYPGQVF